MAAPATTAAEVLDFWFGTAPDDAGVIADKGGLWFTRDDAVDAEIRARFGALREAAIDGALQAWSADPRARLARIILVDQFSRNLFRGDARAFEHDGLARAWTEEALRDGADRRLRPVERVFLYLPLEHSEAAADQARSVALFTALRDEAPPALHEAFASFLDYAVRHRDIVARFGRFPHRNAALGRVSSPEEAAFLAEPGSSF
jgi:uncharacterized protein (DUF924 family)